MANRKAFPLRIDERVYEELEAWAQEELRSVNGQIEFLLRRAVQQRKGAGGQPGPAAAGGGESTSDG